MILSTALGCVLLLISASKVGGIYISQKKEKVKNVRILLELVRYIAVHIEVYREPLPEIFASYDGDKKLSQYLREDGLLLAAKKRGIIPDDEICRLVADIDGFLGKKTAEETVRYLRYCEERIVSYIGTLEEKLPEKERISRAVSILAGASVIILLI